MKDIKVLFASLALFFVALSPAQAQSAPSTALVQVRDLSFRQFGDSLKISMLLDPSAYGLKAGRSLLVTPVLEEASGKSTPLGSIVLLGRSRYLYYLRNGLAAAAGEESSPAEVYPAGASGLIPFEAALVYEPELEAARLSLLVKELGCRACTLSSSGMLIAEGPELDVLAVPVFKAEPLWLAPPRSAGEKTGTLSGRAWVEFPSNVTRIIPERGHNAAELAKITGSIDSVRLDPDISLLSLSIRGYASPEGSYSHNEALAKGRTEALIAYVSGLYDIPSKLLSSSWVAEDWEGLRREVETSGLAGREGIIDIIDNSGLAPDAMESRIKSRYPEDYARLFASVYPSLRHSDYEITYQIRSFTDPAEIRSLARTAPSKLSLEEFFLAAQDCPEGGEEFIYLFETAASMFPCDSLAALNAASAALLRGDSVLAGKRLEAAGNSPEATYEKALLMALDGRHEEALQAVMSVLPELGGESAAKASRAVNQLEEILRIEKRNKTISNKL